MTGEAAEALVLFRQHGHVGIIELNRTNKRNAIDRKMADALDGILTTIEEDPDIRAAVLGARGPVFCAGSDLNAGGDYLTALGGEYGLLRRRRHKPLIAAVERPAIGGGVEIALACDIVVASTEASFSMPEVSRGLVPGYGVFASADLLPPNVARELLLTGRALSAERAHALGFVNSLVSAGTALREAIDLAETIAAHAPISVQATLGAFNDYLDRSATAGWAFAQHAYEVMSASEDSREGVRAFQERRQPRWRGR